jgi:hypothetical protein
MCIPFSFKNVGDTFCMSVCVCIIGSVYKYKRQAFTFLAASIVCSRYTVYTITPLLGVEPGTAVRANPGSWKKVSDPQDLVIFNQARKKFSRFLISQEGRLKSHPSFTSLLQNNLFRETFFLNFYIKTENKRIEITEWNPHSNIIL